MRNLCNDETDISLHLVLLSVSRSLSELVHRSAIPGYNGIMMEYFDVKTIKDLQAVGEASTLGISKYTSNS